MRVGQTPTNSKVCQNKANGYLYMLVVTGGGTPASGQRTTLTTKISGACFDETCAAEEGTMSKRTIC